MKQAALALDHDHVVVLVGQDEFFRGAAEEIGDHAVDGAAAAGHEDAGLARGHERGIDAGAARARGRPRPPRPSCRNCNRCRRCGCAGSSARMPSRLATSCSSLRRRSTSSAPVPRGGPGQFGVVGKKLVQAGDHGQSAGWTASRMIGRQCGGSLPPGGAMPTSRALAPGASASAATTGDGPADAQPAAGRLAGPLAVEHGDDFLRPIADHADRRLGGMRIAITVGQDNHAPRCGHRHDPCFTRGESNVEGGTRAVRAKPQADAPPRSLIPNPQSLIPLPPLTLAPRPTRDRPTRRPRGRSAAGPGRRRPTARGRPID